MPTFKESGYDIEGAGWYGMFAPGKTPDDIVERYNKAIVSAIGYAGNPEAVARLRAGADRDHGGQIRRHPEGGCRAMGAGGEGVRIHAGAVAEKATPAPRDRRLEIRSAALS